MKWVCLLAAAILTAAHAAAEENPGMERRSVVLRTDTPSLTFPAVTVDGEVLNPYAYLIHAGDHARHYGQMATAGVRVYTAGAGLGNAPSGFDPEGIGAAFDEILEKAPDALIFPRIGVTAPPWWHEANPGNRVVFDDGSEGPQSMFSGAWVRDACTWVEDYARWLRTGPYAKNILGIHLCSGETAEWQSWGLWDNRRGDFSEPAVRAWRAYLAEKYGDDAGLAAAWGREVSIAEAAIPTRARREGESPLLRDPADWQDVIDFYDFYWRGTAGAIEQLAAAAKRGGGEDWLVGVFYGYAIMYGGKVQESQHLGMRQLLGCPDIDFFCSPAMYTNRGPGGTSTFMSYTESVQLAGKLWWDEADNRTHLCLGDPFSAVAPAQNLAQSIGVMKREFAHTVSRQAAIWWFDMGGGWYDDATLLALHRDMWRFGEEYRPQWEPPVEIAFFFDDKSNLRMRPDTPYLGHMNHLMANMPRLGAPYDSYLLSDLGKTRDYQVYVFPNAFDLTDEERAHIEGLKTEGHTLVFMGPAGIGRVEGGRVHPDPALSEALIGFEHGGDSASVHAGDGWYGAWFPRPEVSMADLRGVLMGAPAAGARPVHLYHHEDDALYVGNGILALHATEGGEKTVVFPQAVWVAEVLDEGGITGEGTELRFPMEQSQTRVFRITPAKN